MSYLGLNKHTYINYKQTIREIILLAALFLLFFFDSQSKKIVEIRYYNQSNRVRGSGS